MTPKRSLGALAAASALAAAALPAAAGAGVQVGASGWQWGNPVPQGNTLRTMSFVPGGTGYAAGDFGTLLKTVDGGTTWAGLRVGTFTNLTTVQAVDQSTVVAGGGCVARRSTDGGQSFTRIAFTPVEAACKEQLVSLSFVSPTTGFLLLTDGTVLETQDGGTEFTQRTAVPGTKAAGGGAQPTDVAFTTPTTGFAVSTEGKVFQTTDAGVAWKVVSDTARKVADVAFVTPQAGFAVGDQGLFLRTDDGGATWTPKGLGTAANLTAINCASTTLCIVATQKGDVLVRTPDAGATATFVTPSTDPILAAAFASPTRVAAGGANGASVVSDNGGVDFTSIGGRLAGRYREVRAGGQAGTAFAPGADGALARTVDGGKTWTAGNVATSEDVLDVSFPSALIGYALDVSGGLFRTSSGGAAWKTLDPGTTARASAVLAPSADTVLTIGPRGLRRSTDGGGIFEAATDRTVSRAALSGVDQAKGALVVWGSQDVARSTDQGRTWTAVRKPGRSVRVRGKLVNRRGVAQVDFIDARTGFLRDATGRVWRTADGGRHWRELVGVGTAASGMSWATARSGYLVIPGFGDLTRRSGFLLRTTDGGATWHPQLVIDSPIPEAGVAATPGGTDYLLGGDAALLATSTGGDAGSRSALTITTRRRKLTKPASITVTGRLQPAAGNERVTVSFRGAGSTRWVHQTVKTAANGGFTTSWRVLKGDNEFVAQWPGDFRSAGDGSVPLTVTVSARR
jgi:photosystem II stability/assembly factor-like uncharacterized protein